MAKRETKDNYFHIRIKESEKLKFQKNVNKFPPILRNYTAILTLLVEDFNRDPEFFKERFLEILKGGGK